MRVKKIVIKATKKNRVFLPRLGTVFHFVDDRLDNSLLEIKGQRKRKYFNLLRIERYI